MKEKIPNLKNPDGSLTSDDNEKCKVLNDFFVSVFTKEGDNPPPVFNSFNKVTLDDVFIDELDMFNALNNLNTTKSPGPDGIHPRVLQELAAEFAYPLKMIFDKTLASGKLPSEWKQSEVRPIFKKGCKETPGNYRPVSLTAIVCKIFEGFIRSALFNHLTSNNLLSPHQYGQETQKCVKMHFPILRLT